MNKSVGWEFLLFLVVIVVWRVMREIWNMCLVMENLHRKFGKKVLVEVDFPSGHNNLGTIKFSCGFLECLDNLILVFCWVSSLLW